MKATYPSIIVISFCLLFVGQGIFAQVDRQFWFAIPKETSNHGPANFNATNNASFKISAMSLDAKVTISMPANPYFTKRIFTVPAGSSRIEVMASTWVEFDSIYSNRARWNAAPLSGKSLHGILIEADNDITVYYDYDNYWNRDLFSLKGKNALGTEFYTPFQNIWVNGNYNPLPYSSIDIVATEDGTEVDIFPTAQVEGHPWPGAIHVSLKKGETYSFRAQGINAANHLSGTRISSNKKIAVTTNDDSVMKTGLTCKDILGDQLVPTNIIGSKYLVMVGNAATVSDPINLKSVHFIDANTAYITSEFGTISKTSNAGNGWDPAIPITTNHLNSIFSTNTSTSYAAGVGGVILKTVNAGGTWSALPSGTGNALNSIYFPDANNGFAVGVNGTIRRTTNGGTSWGASTSGTANQLNAVFFTNSTTGYAVGNGGVIRKTINGGTTAWTGLASGTGNNLTSVYFTSATTGYAVGQNGTILKTINSGTAWSILNPIANQLNSVFFTDANNGYAVGNAGTILKTTDAGTSWVAQTSGTPNALYSVYFTSVTTGYIVGEKGTLLKTIDGGATWTSNVQIAQNLLRGEQVFVTATQPNTNVVFKDTTGAIIYSTTLSAGQTTYISPDRTNSKHSTIYIESDQTSKPIYVFHITGIGCELGGAILPPITDCTGSNEVTVFPNTTGNPTEITLNMMVPYDKTKSFNDPSQSHNFFTLYNSNFPGGFPIPGSWFEPNREAGWAILTMTDRAFGQPYTGAPPRPGKNLMVYNANKFVNTQDFFHLGMTDGTDGNTNKYGYFSSFNVAKAEVRVATTETQDYIGCYGDTLMLVAKGGLEYTWHYGTPAGLPTYLSDPKSPNPSIIGCPPGSHNFYVEVRQSKCFGVDTLKVNVVILPQTTARFEVDKTSICAVDSVRFTNTSEQAHNFIWTRQIDNNAPSVLPYNHEMNFTEVLDNPSNSVARIIRYKLFAEHNQGCNDTISKVIVVKPKINADFLPKNPVICDSTVINFQNNSGGNLDLYTWDFGDQGSSSVPNPSHLYRNPFTNDTVYNVRLVVKSPEPFFCTDTAFSTVTVHPFVRAGFTVDTVKGCSPFTVKLYNNSTNRNAIGRYFWDFDYHNPSILPRDTLTVFTNKDTIYHTYPRNTTATVKTYIIALKVYDIYGNDCSPAVFRTISVYPEASTLINKPDTAICHGQFINFNTTLADAAVNQFIWTFGDGGTSTAMNPTHQFNNNSKNDTVYQVTLVGLSPEYCAGSDTMLVTVHAKIDPQFSISAPYACAPINATITNATSGGVTSYQWFDGGTLFNNTMGPTIIRNFRNTTNAEVTREIKLVVENSGGCKDSVSRFIKLYPEIQVGFNLSGQFGCNPLTVNFTNTSNTAVATTLFWDFGDGTSSFLPDPTHVFSHTHSNDTVFQIKLKGISSYNCRDSITRPITVYSYVNADFAIDNFDGCAPHKVNISNASIGGIANYVWNYGDGTFDAFIPTTQPKNFSHTYTNTLNRTLTRPLQLVVRNRWACADTSIRTVAIYPNVNASFTTNNVSQGCNPLSVTFTDLSNPAPVPYYWLWEFGDGSTAIGRQTQIHTFENLGNTEKLFKTKLYVFSEYFCSDTAEYNIRVYPFIKADFAFNDPVGCAPHTITLNNGSSSAANRYYWTFGDGTFATANTPTFTHTYQNFTPNTQIYKPKLIAAYNVAGRGDVCKDSISRQVEVYPKVTANFSQDTTKGCHPLTVNFANTSLIGSAPAPNGSLRYSWVYGDKGSSVIKEQPHTFYNYSNADSFYTAKLTATSLFDCTSSISKLITVYPKPKAQLQVDKIIGCPPLRVPINNYSEAGSVYHWTFEPGHTLDTTTLNTIYHVYNNDYSGNIATYNLQLSVESSHNCWDQTSQTIQVYPRVFADFSPDTFGCSPLLVFFKNKTLNASKYKWNFGEGTTNRLTNPSFQYFNSATNDASYTVTLVGESTYGCADTTTRQINVYPQPLAEFLVNPTYVVYPDRRVNVVNQTNPGNWSFLWDFKDGITTAQKDPVMHEYQNWGSYNISLKAWSSNCADSAVHRVTIAPPVPIPDFDLTPDGCVPLTVQFTDKSTWATNWLWEFYDGTTSQERHPVHVFTKPGTYKIKLTVSSDGGSAYLYDEVTVYPKPEVDFTALPTMTMLSEKMEAPVKFYNKSKLGFNYKWDFGDSTYSTENDPVHIYSSIGLYRVGLHAWTDKGCYDVLYKNDYINIMGTGFSEFPNAFTPNPEVAGDGSYPQPDTENKVFHPYWAGVVEYYLEIYDRWGEKLFESNDVKKGWNGWYKNKLCKTDVYIWKARGKYTDGSTFEKAGNVTLLR